MSGKSALKKAPPKSLHPYPVYYTREYSTVLYGPTPSHVRILTMKVKVLPPSKHPQAISLVFAIVMVSVLVIIAATMSASFLRATDRNYDMFKSIQAYYSGRAAMEKALAAAADEGVGFEGSETAAIAWDTDGDSVDDVTGEYELFARSKTLDWQTDTPSTCSGTDYCYVPIPGTGNAAEGCNFEDDNAAWVTDADDNCNWNTIAYGESVTIPLYYTDSGATVNSYATGSEDFILKVRTPIDPDTGFRYILDDSTDDAILNWEFDATCNDGSDYTCFLVPLTILGDETLIYESTINTSSDFMVIHAQDPFGMGYGEDDQGNTDVFIIQFLAGTYATYSLSHTITEPIFKLTIPRYLTEFGTSEVIPYLEYQIVTDTPISDNKIIYRSSGRAEGRSGAYVRNIQASQSIENASVINFIIQN